MGEVAVKKTLYHGEASRMGKFQCTVASDVLKSKYQKGGVDSYYVVLTINGGERRYEIENESCGEVFNGLKGQAVTLEFTGSRSDARVQIVDAGANPRRNDAPPKQEQRKTEQDRPPQGDVKGKSGLHEYKPPLPPTSGDPVQDAIEHIERTANLQRLTMRQTFHLAAEWENAPEKFRKKYGDMMPLEFAQSVNASLFIEGCRACRYQSLPTEPIKSPQKGAR
jgi:hypothetical protein